MNNKYLIRFDDVCPTMDWEQWDRAMKLVKGYNIKPLLGVIPDCNDSKLKLSEPREDFWDYIKELQAKGYEIAMHGYKHEYITKSRGIVGIGKKSEFAGLPYDIQYKMLEEGKKIFNSHDIDVKTFFAPSHTYDKNTLEALNALGFRWVSDGKGLKAKKYKGLVMLPCRSSGVPRLILGKYETIVNHAQEWTLPREKRAYDRLAKFCEKESDHIVDFETFSGQPKGNYFINSIEEKTIVSFQRYIKPVLYQIIKIFRKYFSSKSID